jgi:hypothetical protein
MSPPKGSIQDFEPAPGMTRDPFDDLWTWRDPMNQRSFGEIPKGTQALTGFFSPPFDLEGISAMLQPPKWIA